MPPKSKAKAQSFDNDDQEEYVSLSTVKVLMAQEESAFKSMIDSLITATTTRVDGLVKEIADLKYSLEYSQKDIDRLEDKQSEIDLINNELTNVKLSLDKYRDKTIDLENRSRRNNLRINGIPEVPNETWELTEDLVKSTLKEKLSLNTDVHIERAHRVGKPNGQGRARSIVCRLYDWKDKNHILKQARIQKPTGLFINEDVAETTMEKRREQMPKLRQAKQNGKIAYFVLDKLVIKDKRS